MISNDQVDRWRNYGFNQRGQPATYKWCQQQTPDYKAGTVSRVFTTQDITVLTNAHSDGNSAKAVFRIRFPEAPSRPPSQQDVVVFRALEWKVISGWSVSQTGYVYEVETVRA